MAVDITKCEVHVTVWENENPVPGRSKIVQAHLLDGKTELEPVVDRDLDEFAKFYTRTLKNGPLSPFERAAIKTYIYWKTHPETK
jgi:hypothetical protein